MNFLSTGHLYFLLKPKRSSLLSELFSYEILKKRLDQTNVSYRSYFSIFIFKWDVSESIKYSFIKN